MKRIIHFIPIFLLGFFITAQAQTNVGSYSFSNAVGNYTPLSGDSVITLSSFDDAISSAINIGFNFKLGNQTFTQFKLNANCWITFNTASTSTTQYSVLSSTETQVIASFARDMNGSAGAGSQYSILRTGSSPNRILKIQYKNLFSFSSTIVPDLANMQIWLYETSNVVEIHYGAFATSTRTAAGTVQVGLKSGSTAVDSIRSVSGATWPAAVASNSSTATVAITTTALPDSNRVFTFTPQAAASNDVGVTANLAPVGTIGLSGTPIAPKATVKNFGTANQLVPFNVTYKITGPVNYTSVKTDTVSAGLSNNVTFDSTFVPSVIGTYNVTIYTQLASDVNRANDTLKTTFSVINQNAGSDSGYFYANTLASTSPSFPKYCWKDTSGSKNLVLNAVTAPGTVNVGGLDDGYFILGLKSILLAFGQDTAGKHLRYNGVCYDSIFPGTNGIVGLTQKFGATSLTTFSIDGALAANNALMPIWKDLNLGTLGTGAGSNRLSYKVAGNQLIITYDRAAAFSPATDYGSFQVVIEIVSGCSTNSNFRYTYADTTGGRTSSSWITDYFAGYNAAPGGVTVYRNFLVGFSENGAPSVYGSYVSSANPFPASPSTQSNVVRPIYDPATQKGLAIEFGPNINNLNKMDCLILSLSLTLEGLQNNTSPRVRDTVTIQLRDGNSAPYSVLQNVKVFLDSARNIVGNYSYGKASIQISLLKRGYPFYFRIIHRNSVSSWSLVASTSADTLKYDFTTGLNKIFGNNGAIVHGAASFYTGDVTRDGCVDLSDIVAIYNDASNFVSGDYVITDLNYDGIVDLSDILLAYNNSSIFACEVAPAGAVTPVIIINPKTADNSAPAIVIPDNVTISKEAVLRQHPEYK